MSGRRVCVQCGRKATIEIDGEAHCQDCADDIEAVIGMANKQLSEMTFGGSGRYATTPPMFCHGDE